MSDFRARLFEEFSELQGRLARLERFLISDTTFDALPVIERDDLREQYKHMKAYHDVLSRRVSRQCGAA